MKKLVVTSMLRFERNGKDVSDSISKELKDSLYKEFRKSRNKLVKYMNAHIAEWNEEFYTKYPTYDGWSYRYSKFLAKCAHPYCNKLNKASDALDMYVESEERGAVGDVRARIKGSNIIMYTTVLNERIE